MSIRVSPFAAGLGADIGGVDIRETLSIADRDAIRAAWLDNLVLRFRGQTMDDAQHMAFTGQFGALEFNPSTLIARQYGVKDHSRAEVPPEISVISNIIENGKAIGGLGDGEAFWHTDSSFVDVPPAASLLRSIEVPPPSAGGATEFLNMYSAYDTLADALKERIDGMTMIHAATHSSGGKPNSGFETVTDVSKVPGARQPMVRTHPETGKKALFLGRRINAYVIGLPVEGSEALLDELWSHTAQARFTWRQEWQVGDLIWWDNRCAMHRRDAFDPACRRLMHRTQLKGTRPV
jgi:taurine dioxygenase